MSKKQTTNLAPVDANQRYSIPESEQYLRVSRSEIYLRIQRGTLRVIKDGRRTFVPGSEIVRLSTIQNEGSANG